MILTRAGAERGRGKSQSSADVIHGQFAEILPDAQIVEAVRFETDDPLYRGKMTLTTVLEQLKDGTKVTLIAEDVPPGISEDDHRAGMDAALRSLANFVE